MDKAAQQLIVPFSFRVWQKFFCAKTKNEMEEKLALIWQF